jgi:hypothetical protein
MHLDLSLKMNYITQKRMKKLYGKNLAREISFGRTLLKLIKNHWGHHVGKDLDQQRRGRETVAEDKG